MGKLQWIKLYLLEYILFECVRIKKEIIIKYYKTALKKQTRISVNKSNE